MLTRDPEVAASINNAHINPSYLSEFPLPENISATTDAREALAGAKFILHAIPVQVRAREAVLVDFCVCRRVLTTCATWRL